MSPARQVSIAITPFALRIWEDETKGARVTGLEPDDLVAKCNAAMAAGQPLVDGYALFCKHIFIANTTPTRCGFAEINDANRHLLHSGYRARREGELVVLERWFEGLEAPVAGYFDVILYSHAQLIKEAADFPDEQHVPDCAWGIVSIIPTLDPVEPPMPPITQLRNALGKHEGGSGVAIDRAAYDKAADFWDRHAAIR